MRCTLSGSLSFEHAVTEAPHDTAVTLKAQALLCTDPDVSSAEVTGTLKGPVGRLTSQLTGTLTYAWHLKSGATEPSVQQVSGVGIGGGFSFEGETTSGRNQGRPVRIIPLTPGAFSEGKGSEVSMLARLTIK
ncbi:hypothetical protein J4573_50550 [Actinomadura barringtoniae]|uniref:Uncharacterized protein n=1 Tax=Actinomadura barringtoniae TaxID=1427535 RepID=A0A939PLZ9_9ACTN|nr:hypothetical protein [Actinomadura barringtoniae]MBO2455397.1 hypothetical protein [Actinomadura barringtoniae]